MEIHIVALGKFGRTPEMELFHQYVKRLPWQVILKELEVRKKLQGEALKREEGDLIEEYVTTLKKAKSIFVVALDEHGKNYESMAFAKQLEQWQGQATALVFLIGGADGLHSDILKRVQAKMAFGPMTWPHGLVRAMLAEQLYRGSSILAGHPYHRV